MNSRRCWTKSLQKVSLFRAAFSSARLSDRDLRRLRPLLDVSEAETKQQETKERQNAILLIGPSGVGKSSLANYLCGSPKFLTAATSMSVTPDCDLAYCPDLKAYVVDTPGLRDTRDVSGDGSRRFSRDA